ncbi:Hypothetical Protein FCC1311_015012 [Hondaea fermentalgiana]|uniref:Uncharacterized protein n=1 Tax=Hondaea fermentalgiana TaxID=2315210 RepID=A0A2R5GC05_9STRA|nr:Hypothetical Protein FCC1311_015012 [Hondaea fermentalgiana]|eukprot:GBG25284.1 Hypothetical Protein FCC1311_015012 [Hondaea fermentalgiana]
MCALQALALNAEAPRLQVATTWAPTSAVVPELDLLTIQVDNVALVDMNDFDMLIHRKTVMLQLDVRTALNCLQACGAVKNTRGVQHSASVARDGIDDGVSDCPWHPRAHRHFAALGRASESASDQVREASILAIEKLASLFLWIADGAKEQQTFATRTAPFARELLHHAQRALRDPKWKVRRVATSALAAWAPLCGAESIAALERGLRNGSLRSSDAGLALGKMGPEGTRALIQLAKDPNISAQSRVAAIEGLAHTQHLGPGSIGEHAVDTLFSALIQDVSSSARVAAVHALAKVADRAAGQSSTGAAVTYKLNLRVLHPMLFAALEDPSASVATAAAQTLAAAAPEGDLLLVRAALQSENSRTRRITADALAGQGAHNLKTLLLMCASDADPRTTLKERVFGVFFGHPGLGYCVLRVLDHVLDLDLDLDLGLDHDLAARVARCESLLVHPCFDVDVDGRLLLLEELSKMAAMAGSSAALRRATRIDAEDREKIKELPAEDFRHEEEARYEIYISHMKARGSIFRQPGLEFYLEFIWAGEKLTTPETSAGSSDSKGCVWNSSVLHFDWKENTALQLYSDSMTALHDSVVRRLDKGEHKSGDSHDELNMLVINCFAVRKHHLREKEVWKVGSYRLGLERVMSGPVHHVFVLKDEESTGETKRLSYNCRITQYAHWSLALSDVVLTYEPLAQQDTITDNVDEVSAERPRTESAASDKSDVQRISKTLLQMEKRDVLEKLKSTAFVEDKTRKYILRYKLFRTDGEKPLVFESRKAMIPQMDAVGESYKVRWLHKALPKIRETDETRFRSFLAGTIEFSVYEVKVDDPETMSDSASHHEDASDGQRSVGTKSTGPGMGTGAGQAPETPLAEQDAQLVGECWVPIEQLFELAQVDQDRCHCFDDLSEAGRKNFIHPASVSILRELVLFGKHVGEMRCVTCFDPLPGSVQLGHGVLTEKGVELVSPIVMTENEERPTFLQRIMLGGANATPGDQLTSQSARRLRDAVEALKKNLKTNPHEVPHVRSRTEQVTMHNSFVRTCSELLQVLGRTEKESMISFLYVSTEELLRVQYMLVALWELLLEWLDAATFSIRILFFDVLVAIMKRGELGEFMMAPRDSTSRHDKDSEVARFFLQYRDVCYRTLGWTLKKLSLKGGFPELRLFCARVVAIMSFRLPKFGQLLYQAILPDNEASIKEWARSKALRRVLRSDGRKFLHPEWNAGWYSLTDNFMTTPHSSRTGKRGSSNGESFDSNDSLSGASAQADEAAAQAAQAEGVDIAEVAERVQLDRVRIGQADNEMLLNWRGFHRNLEKLYGRAALEKQEAVLPMGTTKDGNYQAPLWLRRVQKHGHFFFMYSSEWITYVLDTLGVLATQSTENFEGRTFKSGIRWHNIPGYKQILKAFLLELRRREPKEYPESLRKLSLLLLVDNNLVTPFGNIIIPKTNVFDLDSVTTTIDLLSAWFSTVHGWPGRFVAAKVLRSDGPHTALSADMAMSKARSLFFTRMEESHQESKTKVLESLNEVKIKRHESTDARHHIDVAPPPAPMAQLRAAGTLSNEAAKLPAMSSRGVHAVPSPEPYVSAWDFDTVCIYYPHLDVVRRKFKRSEAENRLPGGITVNNDRSKCNWFSYLYADTPPLLPSAFEFKLLAHMLWVLLHQDHFQVVLKTLEFIYNHWRSFPLSFQDRVRTMLLAKYEEDPDFTHHGANDHHLHVSTVARETSVFGMDVIRYSAGGHEENKPTLFVQLFFHWQEEVRHFMHTLLAFRMCRSLERTESLRRILAAVRIALLSVEPTMWDRLWRPDAPIEDRWTQRNCVDSNTVRSQYLLGKSLHRQFEDEYDPMRNGEGARSVPTTPSSQGGGAGSGHHSKSFFKRRGSKENIPVPVKEHTGTRNAYLDDGEILRTRSSDDVTRIVSELSRSLERPSAASTSAIVHSASDSSVRPPTKPARGESLDGADDVTSPRSHPDPAIEAVLNADSVTSPKEAKADLERELSKDLKLINETHWPLYLRAYAVPSVTKFKRIWLNSLDPKVHSPVLEWSVTVMDRGEMKVYGGIAHFQPSGPQAGGYR